MYRGISHYVVISLIALAFTSHTALAYKLKLNPPNTQQSSTDGVYGADKAVDGSTDGEFSHGSCTRTRDDERAWWKVKLGHLHAVDSIKISNTLELINFRRLWKLNITVGNNSDFTQNTECRFFGGPVPRGGTWRIRCLERLYGTYIAIQKTTRYMTVNGEKKPNQGILTLCEVQVFGHIILPKFPGVPSSDPVSASSVQLLWQQKQSKKDANLQLSYHLVQFHLNEGGSKMNPSCSNQTTPNWENKTSVTLLPDPMSNITVIGLKRNQNYMFRVVPVFLFEGDHILGKPSQPVAVKTKCLAPLAPSIILTRADCDSSGKLQTLMVIWKELNDDHRCNSYRELEVIYSAVDSNVTSKAPQSIHIGDPNISNLIINVNDPMRAGLRLGAEFRVAVRVHNDVQLMNISNSVLVRQFIPLVAVKKKCLAPLAPSIILTQANCDYSGKLQSIIVIWKELTDDHLCNRYSKLEVLYSAVDSTSKGQQYIQEGDPSTSNLIINVTVAARAEFRVAVRVHNDFQLMNISNSVLVGKCKDCQFSDTITWAAIGSASGILGIILIILILCCICCCCCKKDKSTTKERSYGNYIM